jgi:hypothetical protein
VQLRDLESVLVQVIAGGHLPHETRRVRVVDSDRQRIGLLDGQELRLPRRREGVVVAAQQSVLRQDGCRQPQAEEQNQPLPRRAAVSRGVGVGVALGELHRMR